MNSVLQTRDSARGLIVNMSDVLFDTAAFTLKPGAREKLAKVAGILLAYPGLNIEVDGHTDNVGSDEYNQNLSDQRAESVRAYLVAQGVLTDSVTAKGFGKTQPVGTNDTAEGRQINRRVELVVSGEAIGAQAGGAAGSNTGDGAVLVYSFSFVLLGYAEKLLGLVPRRTSNKKCSGFMP